MIRGRTAVSEDETVWFVSAVDWWLGALLVALPLAAVGVLIWTVLSGTGEVLVALITLLAVVALYVGLVMPVRYAITQELLVVRFGLVRQRLPLAQIVSVKPSRNPLSSPALSLNRLCIRYGPGLWRFVLVSPADRDGFLELLADRAGLTRQGDCLERRGL